MHVVPFQPHHLRALVLQEAQAWMQPMLQADYGASLAKAGPCFTLEGDEGVICCAGLVNMWENRAQAWALVSADAGRHFVRIYRGMKGFLDLQDTRRIEATVDATFAQGHRLMRMLGFKHEGLMRAYLPDGRDCDLYARVRG